MFDLALMTLLTFVLLPLGSESPKFQDGNFIGVSATSVPYYIPLEKSYKRKGAGGVVFGEIHGRNKFEWHLLSTAKSNLEIGYNYPISTGIYSNFSYDFSFMASSPTGTILSFWSLGVDCVLGNQIEAGEKAKQLGYGPNFSIGLFKKNRFFKGVQISGHRYYYLTEGIKEKEKFFTVKLSFLWNI